MHLLLLNLQWLRQCSSPALYTSAFPYASEPSAGGPSQAAHPILLLPSQLAKKQQKDERQMQDAQHCDFTEMDLIQWPPLYPRKTELPLKGVNCLKTTLQVAVIEQGLDSMTFQTIAAGMDVGVYFFAPLLPVESTISPLPYIFNIYCWITTVMYFSKYYPNFSKKKSSTASQWHQQTLPSLQQ